MRCGDWKRPDRIGRTSTRVQPSELLAGAPTRELSRAVRDLGLRGVFVESAKGDLLLDAPQARPTLAMAASLGVPVFVHPISDRQLSQRFGRYGRRGSMFSRETINAATLIALSRRRPSPTACNAH